MPSVVPAGAISSVERLLAQPIAHRGLHACGVGSPIENSLSAAEAAIAAGYAIECDVQLSRDGEAMVFHDASLDRLTSARGLVEAHDAAALAIPLCGGPDHIPTLAALLATIAGRAPLVIEIKGNEGSLTRLVERCLELLECYAGPVALEGFDPQVIHHCRALRTEHPVGLVGPPEHGAKVDQKDLNASDFLSWSIESLHEAVELCPALPRSAWTVRSASQASVAERHGAQIVFEGFSPSSSVNRVAPL